MHPFASTEDDVATGQPDVTKVVPGQVSSLRGALATKQSILSLRGAMDFGSRSLSSGAHSRDPVARMTNEKAEQIQQNCPTGNSFPICGIRCQAKYL
jgi:hypothetical protein